MYLEMLKTMSLLRRRILGAANRMMSTHRDAFSFSSPRSPWLVLQPMQCEKRGGAVFNFWCCAERRKYLFHDDKELSRYCKRSLISHSDALEMLLLGSSPGWLAFQHPDDFNFLLDPVSYDAVYLPPWNYNHAEVKTLVKTLVFSDSEGKAFVIPGSGNSLAFCSTSTHRPRDGWTPFGGGGYGYYESMAYSTARCRLLCITSSFKLEAWDVGHDSPRLDWVAHLDGPDPPGPGLLDLKYLACEEQSGKLFLVVRQVRSIDYYSKEDLSVDFKVYRIEDQRLDLNLMRDSLEGMAFFVGSNQAIAMRDAFGLGVEPDSVYFTFDRRLEPYGNIFVGNFDYRRRSISRVSCPVGGTPYPVWFTPHPRHIILLP